MKILLFSGGLDSYIISKLEKPDKNLYFDIGLKYNRAEIKNIERLDVSVLVLKPFGMGGVGGLKAYELENKIIPLRNLYFAMLASNYGDDVILGATEGDSTRDKDQEFCDLTNKLIRYVFNPPEKTPMTCRPPKEYTLRVPYKTVSKSELVEAYLSKGFDKKWLYKTKSCYGAGEVECGECRSCFRKAVALKNNDIYLREIFEADPFEGAEMQLEYAEGVGRKKEVGEIKKAMKKPRSNASLRREPVKKKKRKRRKKI